ncbi:MAG TPA: hypothetical protein VD948_02440, partial [Rhodothermales bacterium]|nr:hypothetical protein [Rhodothermales bacterium]
MTARPVSFARLPGFSGLFRAYIDGDARLADHFAYPDWASEGALRAAGEAAASFPRDRAGLGAALRAQQTRWGDDPSVASAL